MLSLFWEKLGAHLTYEEYIAAALENGCRVIRAEYTFLYTEEKRAQGPQLPGGEWVEHWLLVPDEEGRLRLFANDRFYSPMGPVYVEDEIFAPAALDMR